MRRLVYVAAAATLVIGCGGDDITGTPDAEPLHPYEGGVDRANPDSGVDGGGAGDSSEGGADAEADSSSEADSAAEGGFVMANHPALPQLQHWGGPVLGSPVFVSVTFPSYDHTMDVDALVGSIGTLPGYWLPMVGEYGVGTPTAKPPVHLTEAAPASIDDGQIQTWLVGKLNGNDPAFPAATSSTVYVLYYPSTTTVTMGGATACFAFGGYHSDIVLDVAHGSIHVPYAVIPECDFGGGVLPTVTGATSHELAEASTNPYPQTMNSWVWVDDADAIWEAFGPENGDLCAPFPDAFFVPAGYAYTVQRCWSNRSAAGGHNPCAPVPSSPYFNAAPVLMDDTTLLLPGQTITTKGALIPLNQSKTVEVDLFSDAPTTGPWTVSADDLSQFIGGGPYLGFTWDRTTGQNGDKLHLTIKALAPTGTMFVGGEAFEIVSTLGSEQHSWLGYVAQN